MMKHDIIFRCWRKGYRCDRIRTELGDDTITDTEISDLFKIVTERYWNGK